MVCTSILGEFELYDALLTDTRTQKVKMLHFDLWLEIDLNVKKQISISKVALDDSFRTQPRPSHYDVWPPRKGEVLLSPLPQPMTFDRGPSQYLVKSAVH